MRLLAEARRDLAVRMYRDGPAGAREEVWALPDGAELRPEDAGSGYDGLLLRTEAATICPNCGGMIPRGRLSRVRGKQVWDDVTYWREHGVCPPVAPEPDPPPATIALSGRVIVAVVVLVLLASIGLVTLIDFIER